MFNKEQNEKEILVTSAIAKAMRAVGEAMVTIADVLLGECGPAQDAPAPAPTEAKKSEEAPARRGRKPKSTTPPPEEAEEETDEIVTSDLKSEPDETDDFAGLDEENEAPEVIDEAKLRTALVEFAKANGGKEAAFAVLGKFKAKVVKDLKPEQYAKVYAELQKGL